MIVITLTDCPISLRGDLTKWLLEINTGVFVGKVSARVRDNLWKRVIQNVKNGRATLVYSTNNEQRMDFRIHHSTNKIIDFDGLKLVMKPSPAQTKKFTEKRMGFSKAAKMRMARKKQNSKVCKEVVLPSDYPSDYVVVDLETSGLDAKKNEIIEVGMLKVHQNEVVQTFSVLIKPEQLISKQIEEMTGITNDLLEKQGGEIGGLLLEIKEFIGQNILIGHNVLFDKNFLNQAFLKDNYDVLDNQYRDTMKMYADIFKPNIQRKRLADIATEFNIKVNKYHRGLADCYTVKAIYDILKKKIEN
jgi:CRISPR-associated protein Cas2